MAGRYLSSEKGGGIKQNGNKGQASKQTHKCNEVQAEGHLLGSRRDSRMEAGKSGAMGQYELWQRNDGSQPNEDQKYPSAGRKVSRKERTCLFDAFSSFMCKGDPGVSLMLERINTCK